MALIPTSNKSLGVKIAHKLELLTVPTDDYMWTYVYKDWVGIVKDM